MACIRTKWGWHGQYHHCRPHVETGQCKNSLPGAHRELLSFSHFLFCLSSLPSLHLQSWSSCVPRGAAPPGSLRDGWSGRLDHLAGSSAPAQPETELVLVVSHVFTQVLCVHSLQRPRGHEAKAVEVPGKWDTEFLFSQELTTAYTY